VVSWPPVPARVPHPAPEQMACDLPVAGASKQGGKPADFGLSSAIIELLFSPGDE